MWRGNRKVLSSHFLDTLICFPQWKISENTVAPNNWLLSCQVPLTQYCLCYNAFWIKIEIITDQSFKMKCALYVNMSPNRRTETTGYREKLMQKVGYTKGKGYENLSRDKRDNGYQQQQEVTTTPSLETKKEVLLQEPRARVTQWILELWEAYLVETKDTKNQLLPATSLEEKKWRNVLASPFLKLPITKMSAVTGAQEKWPAELVLPQHRRKQRANMPKTGIPFNKVHIINMTIP